MAEINPYTQSLAENIAIAEAQRRLTMGQQQAQRNQALARARALRGRQVLAEMAREAALNERAMVAREKVAQALANLDTKKRIEQSTGIAGALAKGTVLAAAEGLFDDPEMTLEDKNQLAGMTLGSPEQYDETLGLNQRMQAAGRSLYDVNQMTDPAYAEYVKQKEREDMLKTLQGQYIPEMFE